MEAVVGCHGRPPTASETMISSALYSASREHDRSTFLDRLSVDINKPAKAQSHTIKFLLDHPSRSPQRVEGGASELSSFLYVSSFLFILSSFIFVCLHFVFFV